MLRKTIKINSSIETKDVALIVQKASTFSSSINIQINNKTANAKSIMGLITLGNFCGEEIDIIADGPDEKNVIEDFCNFFS